MPEARKWLGDDEEHAKATHWRWVREYRLAGTSAYPDDWRPEQCGACRYYIHLTGRLIDDWGICSNPASQFDGIAMFEHDGCDQFAEARDGWGGPHRSYNHLRGHHYGETPSLSGKTTD